MGAYVLGYCVSLADESLAFLHSDVGPQFTEDTGRLTGGGLNQNDIAIVGAIVIPIAAYLALRAVKNPILRVGCWALIPVAALGVVMTGSRSGTAAMLLGVSVLTLSLRRATWGFRIMFIVAGLAGAMLVMYLAPERILARVSEGTESATFQTRHEVWMLALQRWADSPILGSGVGTFIRAVWGSTGGLVAHNAFISVLVETGVVGLMFYAGAVLTTFYYVWRLPAEDRPFFLAILVIWIVAAMVGPWEYNKTSWFLFSILTTISVTKQAATSAQKGLASPSPPALVASPLGGSRLGPA
jgi:O-antigen ligase